MKHTSSTHSHWICTNFQKTEALAPAPDFSFLHPESDYVFLFLGSDMHRVGVSGMIHRGDGDTPLYTSPDAIYTSEGK